MKDQPHGSHDGSIKKKPAYSSEVIFKNKVHMQAYLVDKVAANRNKNFNMIVKLT
jgi:hypothetical protein